MRGPHDRLSFTFDVYSTHADLDVSCLTRGLIDRAQERLRGWIGDWLDPAEERPMTLSAVERRVGSIVRITVISPATVAGRTRTYLTGLLFHADHAFRLVEKRRHALVILHGPMLHTLHDLRALPIRFRDAAWLLEWNDPDVVDADAFCLSRSANERLVAGQLDADTRRRIDAARAAGHADDPLSARIHLDDQAAIVAALQAGEPSALDEAALLARPAPETVRALIASARVHGHDRVTPIVIAMITVPGVIEQLAPAWHAGGEQERQVAEQAAKRSLNMYYRRASGQVTRQTVDDLDPVLRPA